MDESNPTIKFNHRFVPLIKDRTKTLTTRTKIYGKPGDVLEVLDESGAPQGFSIRLLQVQHTTLGFVARNLYDREGCTQPKDFVDSWTGFYGAFDPDQLVYVYEFEVLIPNQPRPEDMP